ncbi:MAG: indole-3-glycerol-phosphate synthase, partial [Saprospiraceae bacterium]
GDINKYADAEEVTLGYMQAGASALSVLTDEHFFGARKNDLQVARKFNYCPILRKDFIIDEYQIIESKSMGADAILLIAKILSPAAIKQFILLAHELNMQVLLEMHSEKEIEENAEANNDLTGINSRNLDNLEVDIDHSIRLANLLTSTKVKIAESGIDSVEKIRQLKQHGFDGFLIGEYFMSNSHPAEKCKELIKKLRP